VSVVKPSNCSIAAEAAVVTVVIEVFGSVIAESSAVAAHNTAHKVATSGTCSPRCLVAVTVADTRAVVVTSVTRFGATTAQSSSATKVIAAHRGTLLTASVVV
jgi:hypothetical protein